MVKEKINSETREEKFKRIAEAGTNKILELIRLLRNCSKKRYYEYLDKQTNQVFSAIEEEIKISKNSFNQSKKQEVKL